MSALVRQDGSKPFVCRGTGCQNDLANTSRIETETSLRRQPKVRLIEEVSAGDNFRNRLDCVGENPLGGFGRWHPDGFHQIRARQERSVYSLLKIARGDKEQRRKLCSQLIKLSQDGIGGPVHVDRVCLQTHPVSNRRPTFPPRPTLQ